MSHFTVAVFTENGLESEVDELLRPYSEQDESLFTFHAEWENKREAFKEYEEWRKTASNEDKRKYSPFDTWIKEWHGYKEHNGQYGYYCNEEAKWDWYEVGGRWDGYMKNKDGEETNCCLVRDVSMNPDTVSYENAIREWEVIVEGDKPKDKEFIWCGYKKEDMIAEYGTKEKYAQDEAEFTAYAYIDLYGEWHEPGMMGFFGMSDASPASTKEYRQNLREYMKNNPDLYVTIVDCHI